MKRPLLLLAAVSVLAACGSTSHSSSAGRATASPAPSTTAAAVTPTAPAPAAAAASATQPPAQQGGFNVRQTARFEIALPAAWRELPLTKEQIQAAARQLGAANPDLARTLNGLVDTGNYKQLDFYAFDPQSLDAVNVLHAAVAAGVTSQQLLDQMRPSLPQIVPGTTVRNGRAGLTINGLDASEIEYEVAVRQLDGALQTFQGVQFYIIAGTEVHVVSVVGSPRPALVGLAEQIGDSFKLK